MKERSINHLLRERILELNSNELRVEYFRPDEGMKIYHVSRGVIIDLAEEADALYKVGRSCMYKTSKVKKVTLGVFFCLKGGHMKKT